MSKKLLDVGPLELEVLGILNASGEQAVGGIQTALKRAGHDLAYTTVMTVLVRLYKKELVQRRKEGRLFLYQAVEKKGSSPLKIFERVRDSLFQSDRLRPILSLLESKDDLSKEELLQLKKAVEAKLRQP